MADPLLASNNLRRNEPSSSRQQLPARTRRTPTQNPLQQGRGGSRTLRSQSRETADDATGSVAKGTRGELPRASAESVGSGQGSDAKAARRKGKGRALGVG